MDFDLNVTLSLFDGISCGQEALKRAGLTTRIFLASEIEKYPKMITRKNHPLTVQLGSVETIEGENLPKIDIIFAGSPCQDVSFATQGKGLIKGERSNLFFEFLRILEECRRFNPDVKFLLENVRMKQEFQDLISRHLETEPVKINSDRFVPQNRNRLYWTNIDIAPLPERPAWNKQYYQWRRTYFRENKSGVCPTLTANMGTGGHNVPLYSKDLKDRLSPVDCEKLQGLPDDYTEGVSNTQRFKALGNGWTVSVIVHILQGLKKELSKKEVAA